MDDKNTRLESEWIAGRRLAADAADSIGEKAANAAASLREAAANAAGTVRDAAAGAAASARDAASNAAGTVRQAAAGAAASARDAASNAADSARDAAGTAVGAVRGVTASAADTVRQGASSAAGAVREVAGTATDSVRAAAGATARDFAESDSVRYLRANPLHAVLLAAGIGGLAWLLGGPRRPRRGSRRRPPLRRSGPDDSGIRQPGLGNSRVQYDAGAEYGRLGESDARRMATSGAGGTDEWGGTQDWAAATKVADDHATRDAGDGQRDTDRTAGQARPQPRQGGSGHPFLIGAAAAIIGAVAGAALSECVRESEWLGEAAHGVEPGAQPSSGQTPGGFGGAA